MQNTSPLTNDSSKYLLGAKKYVCFRVLGTRMYIHTYINIVEHSERVDQYVDYLNWNAAHACCCFVTFVCMWFARMHFINLQAHALQHKSVIVDVCRRLLSTHNYKISYHCHFRAEQMNCTNTTATVWTIACLPFC